jgi:hypothetical protein
MWLENIVMTRSHHGPTTVNRSHQRSVLSMDEDKIMKFRGRVSMSDLTKFERKSLKEVTVRS